MNPLALLKLIDVPAIGKGLSARYEKDAARIGMFFPAVSKRAIEMANDPALAPQVPAMLAAAADLGAEYAKAANPRKWSLGSLLGNDPFRGAREDVRAFAKRYGLDPAFVQAMG